MLKKFPPRSNALGLALRLSVALLAMLALGSCSSTDGFLDNDDCDYVMSPGIGSGEQDITTDRMCPSFLSLDLECGIDFRDPGGPGATPGAQFYLAYYDVSYRNDRTGGTTPGVDVPAPFRAPLMTVIEEGGEATFDGWPILQPGQKLNPPLNDDSFYGSGGTPMTVTLTWWGWPLADPEAVCFAVTTWQITVYTTGPHPDPDDPFFDDCD